MLRAAHADSAVGARASEHAPPQLQISFVREGYLSGKPNATPLGRRAAAWCPTPVRFLACWSTPLACLISIYAVQAASLVSDAVSTLRNLQVCTFRRLYGIHGAAMRCPGLWLEVTDADAMHREPHPQ
jgi:hypothetical protein